MADEAGYHSFAVPAGDYDLIISKAGCPTAHASVTMLAGETS